MSSHGSSAYASSSQLPAANDRYALDEQVILADLAHLSIEDAYELPSQQKGNSREVVSLTDSDSALRIFSEDASDITRFNDDCAFAQRLSDTWELLDRENVSFFGDWDSDYTIDLARFDGDRAPARRLSEDWTLVAHLPTQNTYTHRTETRGWFRSFTSFLVDHRPGPTAPPSITQPINARPEISQPKLNTPICVICQEPIRRGADIRVPCGHHYDRSCAVDLFEAATRDESLFPPRCCKQTIPFAEVKPHVSAGFIKLFTEKVVEFGTLKRVYCASWTCSRFLGPQTMGWFTTTYTCKASGCRTVTCGRCRMKITPGVRHTCKIDDELDQQVLALGQQQGWARCPGCAQLIELNAGCFHMTCMCKTQFCYLCQALWKTCGCPQWEERRILTAAEEHVDVQPDRAHPHEPLNVAPARVIQRAGGRVPGQPDPTHTIPHQLMYPPELPPAIPRAGRRIPAPPNPIYADLREAVNFMPLPPMPAGSVLHLSRTTTASSSQEESLVTAAEERVDAQLGIVHPRESLNVVPAHAIPMADRRVPEQTDPRQIIRHQPMYPSELPPAIPRAGRRIPAPSNPIYADLREAVNFMPLPPMPAGSALRRSRTTTASSSMEWIPTPPNPIRADLRELGNFVPLPPTPAKSALRNSRTTTVSSSGSSSLGEECFYMSPGMHRRKTTTAFSTM